MKNLGRPLFSMSRAALSNTRPCRKEGYSFIHFHSVGPELENSPKDKDPIPSVLRFSVQPTPTQVSTPHSADADQLPLPSACLNSKRSPPGFLPALRTNFSAQLSQQTHTGLLGNRDKP